MSVPPGPPYPPPPPPPPPPGPAPGGPPAWPFVIAGVALVVLAVGAVVLLLKPFDDEGEGGAKKSVPAGAVAVVGEEEISRADFDHWLENAARGRAPPGGGEPVVIPRPPDFIQCVEAKRDEPTPRGAPTPSETDLREQCEQEYEGLRDQVMQFLVQSIWIEFEAEERGIEVSDADVRQAFDEQKSQSFEKEEDYREFLRTSGQTEADLLYRVRIDLLSERIRQEVIREGGGSDQEDVDAFVEDFQERYREMTVCAEGFVLDVCSNGPPLKPDTGTTPAPPAPGGVG
jgi:hypothetical protein